MNIKEIEGIGPVFAGRLTQGGVRTTDALLREGATPAGRERLATVADVSTGTILEWVNRADLMRIKGVGSEYSDLLEAAGVDTVPELAQRNSVNLHEALVRANEAKPIVRRLPTANAVFHWVEQAKVLGRAVQY